MAVWPLTLPDPLLNTLNETLPKNIIKTQTDKGPAKVRRRSTANSYPISFQMKLSPAQLVTLKTFFNVTTFSGAVSFTFTHPKTNEVLEARFTEEPNWTDVEGIRDAVSISLEILP